MMDVLERAETLEKAAFGSALDPLQPVRPGHASYVNLDAMLPPEHYGVTTRLDARFRNAGGSGYLHLALVGQGGTGKSTLVREAMLGLRDIGIMPVYVNANETFDRSSIDFADVVLVLVEAVVRELVDKHNTVSIDPQRLERVRRWFADEVIGETQRRELHGEITSGATAQVGMPGLASLASSVKKTLREDNDYRREIRQKAARDPEELITGANSLLQAVHVALASRKQQLCVVFDNLEKLHDRQQVYRAFLSRAEDLRRLLCHAVYFLSPADQYTPVDVQANQSFTYIDVPAIPIRQDRAEPFDFAHDDAINAIATLLNRRIDTSRLFVSPDGCTRLIARSSGGRLRDIIELARQACEFAHFDRNASKVDTSHVGRAARRLAALRLTAMTDVCWERAREIHSTHDIMNRPEDALMLRNSLVLAYDGEPWWDVHPFVRADPRFGFGA